MTKPYPATVADALKEGRVGCLRVEYSPGVGIAQLIPVSNCTLYDYVAILTNGTLIAVGQDRNVHYVQSLPVNLLALTSDERPRPSPGFFQFKMEKAIRALTEVVELHRDMHSPVRAVQP